MINFFTKLLTPLFISLGLVNPVPIVENPVQTLVIPSHDLVIQEGSDESFFGGLFNSKDEMVVESVKKQENQILKETEIVNQDVAIPDKPVGPQAITDVVFQDLLKKDTNLSIAYDKARISKPTLSCSVNYSKWDGINSPSVLIFNKKKDLESIIEKNYSPTKDDLREYNNLIEWITGASSFSPGYSKGIQDYVIKNTPNPQEFRFDFSGFNVNQECITETNRIITLLMSEKLETGDSVLLKKQWIEEQVRIINGKRIAGAYVQGQIDAVYQKAELMDFGAKRITSINTEIQKLNELITLLKR